MKHGMKTIIALTVGALMVFGTSTAFAAEPVQNTIQVTGNGRASATPDRASMYFSVETKADTAQKAQAENATKAETLVQALVADGVDKEDIISGSYYVTPEYFYEPETGKETLEGYRAYQRFTVETDDVDGVGALMQTAVNAGAYVDGNARFFVKDTNALYQKALAAAMTNAKQTADFTASSMGMQVTGVHSVQVDQNYNSYEEAVTSSSMAPMNAKGAVAEDMAVPEIRYDDVEVNASVQVWYLFGK